MKKKTKRKWLLVAIGLLLIFIVGKACYNSHSDTDKEEIALDQEVELYSVDDAPLHINEDELLATKYDPNSLSYLIALRQSIKDSMQRMMAWESDVPKSRAPYDITMPYKNEFFDLAMQEAKSGDYKYLASQGYSDEAIARMIVEKYYQPALFEVTGKKLRPTDELTPEQLNNWRDLQVNRQIAAAEAMNPDFKATDADRKYYSDLYSDNMKAIATNANKRRMESRKGLLPAQEMIKTQISIQTNNSSDERKEFE